MLDDAKLLEGVPDDVPCDVWDPNHTLSDSLTKRKRSR
jgi:hypothetical protein